MPCANRGILPFRTGTISALLFNAAGAICRRRHGACGRGDLPIGIRMALGAGARDVFRLIGAQAAAVIVSGSALGLAGAMALTWFLSSEIWEVKADDPRTFGSLHCSARGDRDFRAPRAYSARPKGRSQPGVAP